MDMPPEMPPPGSAIPGEGNGEEVGPAAAGGVAVALAAAAAVAGGASVAGCTVTTVGCDALIASDVAGCVPEPDSGVDGDMADKAADPTAGVDVEVSVPPQPITSRVIKHTAAIAMGAPVMASRPMLPATSSSVLESRPGLDSAPPTQGRLQHFKVGLRGGAGDSVDGNDVLRAGRKCNHTVHLGA